MYNKTHYHLHFLKSVAYERYIFHLINDTQNGGTLWPKFIYILLVFMDLCKQKIIITNHTMKKIWMFFYPHVHMSSTTIKHFPWKILKPKMWQQKWQEMLNS
jgi:hypothetical protein